MIFPSHGQGRVPQPLAPTTHRLQLSIMGQATAEFGFSLLDDKTLQAGAVSLLDSELLVPIKLHHQAQPLDTATARANYNSNRVTLALNR